MAEAILKSFVGLMVNISRDKIADLLEDQGDILNQRIGRVFRTDATAIKKKLDDILEGPLLVSVEHLQKGIINLRNVLLNSNQRNATGGLLQLVVFFEQTAQSPNCGSISLLKDAKREFEKSLDNAMAAFKPKTLPTSNCIRALEIQVMAEILRCIDRPKDALDLCIRSLEKLNNMPAVKQCLKVLLSNSIKARILTKERRDLLVSVCRINYSAFRIMQFLNWEKLKNGLPLIDVGKEPKVDVLRDPRIIQILLKADAAEFHVGCYSVGHQWNGLQKLKCPRGITTNSQAQFIVAEGSDNTVKVYSRSGKFVRYVRLPSTADNVQLLAVSSGPNDILYVLTKEQTIPQHITEEKFDLYWVHVIASSDNHSSPDMFPVINLQPRINFKAISLTVNDSDEVFVLGTNQLMVFKTTGEFVRSFGEGQLERPCDITAATDGRIFVLDRGATCGTMRVQRFTAEGVQLEPYPLPQTESVNMRGSIVHNNHNGTVAVSLWNSAKPHEEGNVLYTNEGEAVCVFKGTAAQGIAATTDGRIAVITTAAKLTSYHIWIADCIELEDGREPARESVSWYG